MTSSGTAIGSNGESKSMNCTENMKENRGYQLIKNKIKKTPNITQFFDESCTIS